MFYLSSELHTFLPEPVSQLPTPIPSFAPIFSPTGESALIACKNCKLVLQKLLQNLTRFTQTFEKC